MQQFGAKLFGLNHDKKEQIVPEKRGGTHIAIAPFADEVLYQHIEDFKNFGCCVSNLPRSDDEVKNLCIKHRELQELRDVFLWGMSLPHTFSIAICT